MEKFAAEAAALTPENKQLAQALVRRCKSYNYYPKSKADGMKLLPFAESKEMVFLLADILKTKRYGGYPEIFGEDNGNPYRTDKGYATFFHILIMYVINQKESYNELLPVLNCLIDRVVEIVMRNEDDYGRYYMHREIFKSYKANKEPLLNGLVKKFDIIPHDQLMFIPAETCEGAAYYKVKAYPSTCGVVKIPQSHKGKPVKEIVKMAFFSHKLTSIDIPEGIEIIGDDAFHDCKKLENLILPKSLKTIGNSAFAGCIKIKEAIIPENVTEMGKRVFQSLPDTRKINININVSGRTEKPGGWHEDWDKNWAPNQEPVNVIWGYKE